MDDMDRANGLDGGKAYEMGVQRDFVPLTGIFKGRSSSNAQIFGVSTTAKRRNHKWINARPPTMNHQVTIIIKKRLRDSFRCYAPKEFAKQPVS